MFKIPLSDRSYYFFAHPYRLYGVNIMKIQAIENLEKAELFWKRH